MTPLDATLAELAELEGRATPGPWGARGRDVDAPTGGCLLIVYGSPPCAARPHRDAAFIAAARNALPAILSDRSRLVKERDEARAVVERAASLVAAGIPCRCGHDDLYGGYASPKKHLDECPRYAVLYRDDWVDAMCAWFAKEIRALRALDGES